LLEPVGRVKKYSLRSKIIVGDFILTYFFYQKELVFSKKRTKNPYYTEQLQQLYQIKLITLGVLGTLQVIQPSRSIDGRANLK
jgi:hypothetical protein